MMLLTSPKVHDATLVNVQMLIKKPGYNTVVVSWLQSIKTHKPVVMLLLLGTDPEGERVVDPGETERDRSAC